MKYLSIIVLLTLVISTSCSNSLNKENLQQLVKTWQGKHINLPPNMVDFFTGDTIDLNDNDFTILAYVDSIGCTGCKMNLSLWNEYLIKVQDITDSKVGFVMIVNTKDSLELRNILSQYSFSYPIYWDYSNIISTSNNISYNHRLQTFLLDRHRNVIVIGNPAISSEIEKIYNPILSGKTAVSKDCKSTVFTLDNDVNIGSLKPGESKSMKLAFTNQGNDSIKIIKLLSSCECIEIEFNQNIIEPQTEFEAILKVQADTLLGEFERTIQIFYENFEYPTTINISGNIIK